MARLNQYGLRRVLGTSALFSTAYGNVGSSIYYALGVTAAFALGLTPVAFVIAGLIFMFTAASYTEATVMYPEAGGSASFARHAFNELVSFIAAWGQMLNYIITVAISAFFVPHYLGVFWPALHHSPGDIIGGIVIVALLCTVNIIGVRESARLNLVLAVIDFATQLLLLLLGIFPRGQTPAEPLRNSIVQVNSRIAALDDGDRIRYLHIGSNFLQPDGTISPLVMPDFLHPSEWGYLVYTGSVWGPVMDLLETVPPAGRSPAPR